ncbi:hypothetical protein LTS18_013132, partial [Coniosporium uncinatum]
NSLLGFLEAVSPSLRDLELDFVLLREECGSWNDIIYRLPEILTLDRIEMNMVHDFEIVSPTEDDSILGRRLFELGLHPGRSCYATQVQDYILKRTTQRPTIDIDEFNETHMHGQRCDTRVHATSKFYESLVAARPGPPSVEQLFPTTHF